MLTKNCNKNYLHVKVYTCNWKEGKTKKKQNKKKGRVE
jgi:hypothetical protein